MSTDRDTTRIVRSWLRTDEHESADRVLHAVLDRLDTTPQRRFTWWPARRFPDMNTTAKLTLAAAAVVVAAFLGIRFLAPGEVGIGAPGPTPTPTAPPLVLPATTSRTPLEPGTYVTGGAFQVPVTVTVPAGWAGNTSGPYLANVGKGIDDQFGGVFFQIFEQVSVDPCQPELGFIDPLGPTADDLVTALTNMPGIEVADVSDITVDGFSGTQLTVTAPESFDDCSLSEDGYVIWRLPLGATYAPGPGLATRVRILDVGDERLVIDVPDVPGTTDEERAEIQAVVDSIQIEAP
jgi:hypothetical protein